MLGLIRGSMAGETPAEPLAAILLRFLLPLAPLLSSFLSFSSAPGVDTIIGEPLASGLASGLAEDGVLSGPSFGVLRADMRGVCSSEPSGINWVCIWVSEGRRDGRFAAAAGKQRSSNWSPLVRSISGEPLIGSGFPSLDRSDLGVAAGPAVSA